MSKKPSTIILRDGSRHFADLPQSRDWYDVRDHINRLSGAVVTGFLTDHVTEAWIDFTYRGYSFSINDQHRYYWFSVNDPTCPDEILVSVITHWQELLGDSWS